MPPDVPETTDKSGLDDAQPPLLENQQGDGSQVYDVESPTDRDADELLTDIKDGESFGAYCGTCTAVPELILKSAGLEFSSSPSGF